MSLSKEQMIELMKYADGELATEEREAVKATLASSSASNPSADEARAFLAEMTNLAGWVEEADALSVGAAADSFDIADAVMAKLDADDSDDSRTAETAPRKTDSRDRSTDRSKDLPVKGVGAVSSIDVAREKRNRVFVVVATAVAMAAGIALLLRHPAEEHKAVNAMATNGIATNGIATNHALDKLAVPSAHANLSPASSEASQTLANAGDKAGEPGVEVNVATDSSQTGVSVFYLPGTSSTAASAVVWIDDDTGGK